MAETKIKKPEEKTSSGTGLPPEVADKFQLKPGIPARKYLIPGLGITVDLRTITLQQAEYVASKDNSLIEAKKKP